MGKKKKGKEFRETAFDYMSGGRIRNLGDRVGVDASDYNINMGRPSGSGRTYKGDRDDYKKAVTDAARNDYDYRRTLEAAAMSGKKKAQKLQSKGFNDIQDVLKADNFSRKAAKRHGQGGDFSSNSDYMGLTKSMVKRDRRKQTEGYDKQYASQEMLNSRLEKLKGELNTRKAEDDAPEYKESEEFSAAKERLSEGYYDSSASMYEGAEAPITAFRKTNDAAPSRDDSSTATNSYLEQYKEDMIKGGRIGEARSRNLNNAYNTVINSDI